MYYNEIRGPNHAIGSYPLGPGKKLIEKYRVDSRSNQVSIRKNGNWPNLNFDEIDLKGKYEFSKNFHFHEYLETCSLDEN